MTRNMLIPLAAVAFAASHAPAIADTSSDIAAIEQRWGEAFLKGDRAFIERLVAPEFVLMRAEGGKALFTPRADWLANYERFVFHAFEVKTVGVVGAGDTAVATVTGRWKVGLKGREGAREEAFVLSDTFVRRGGAWQVVYRHSSPFPLDTAKAAAPAGGEKGD